MNAVVDDPVRRTMPLRPQIDQTSASDLLLDGLHLTKRTANILARNAVIVAISSPIAAAPHRDGLPARADGFAAPRLGDHDRLIIGPRGIYQRQEAGSP